MWIRSQNKTVLKDCDCFEIGMYQGKPAIYGIKGEWMLNANDGMLPYRLGQYDTEQRAIEVLGEIQKQLTNISGTSSREVGTDCVWLRTEYQEVVFQMPEE